LKRELGDDAHILKEVQSIKTGFALYTDSLVNLSTLEGHKERLSLGIQDCTIERREEWTIYKVNNVPRSVQTLGITILIAQEHLIRAISEVTG
jgi:hypothetical protein